MFLLTRKNLFQDKTRFLISCGGVAFSVLLIVVLLALYQGWSYVMGGYVRSRPADIWVGQTGSKDMFHSISFLPLVTKDSIAKVQGVTSVEPFEGRRMGFEIGGKETSLFIVSHQNKEDISGPVIITSGKHIPEVGEIILDQTVLSRFNLKQGDSITLAKKDFKIAGVSTGGSVVVYAYAFISKADADEIFKTPTAANYFLVQVDDKSQAKEIADKIEDSVPSTRAFTKEEFVNENIKIISDTFLPIISVLLAIGFVVGIAVIGLTIYTSAIEKSREYGVLKAIGLSSGKLYLLVLGQSLILSLLGYIIGSIGAVIINQTISQRIAEFVTYLRWEDFALTLAAALAMSLIASYIPIRRISQIDPAEVFKQ